MKSLFPDAALPALALVFLLASAGASAASDQGNVAAGKRYAETYCAECHAIGPDTLPSRVREARSFPDVANTPGMTQTALAVWLQTMHPSMPNIMLEPDDLNNVIAYIVSLKN